MTAEWEDYFDSIEGHARRKQLADDLERLGVGEDLPELRIAEMIDQLRDIRWLMASLRSIPTDVVLGEDDVGTRPVDPFCRTGRAGCP